MSTIQWSDLSHDEQRDLLRVRNGEETQTSSYPIFNKLLNRGLIYGKTNPDTGEWHEFLTDAGRALVDKATTDDRKARIMDTLNTAAEGLREVKARLEATREPEYDPDPVEHEHLNSASYGNDDNSVSPADEMLQDELMQDYEVASALDRFNEIHKRGADEFGLLWLSANLEVSSIAQQDYVLETYSGDIHPAIKAVLSESALVVAKHLRTIAGLHAEIEKLQADIVTLTARNQTLQGDLKAAQEIIVDTEKQIEVLEPYKEFVVWLHTNFDFAYGFEDSTFPAAPAIARRLEKLLKKTGK